MASETRAEKEKFMDALTFKAAMRNLGASVCVITTAKDTRDRNGCTATAVCSLSANPASLLCCLNQASNSHAAIIEARAFCVNVLAAEHIALADRFASNLSASEKFATGDWRIGQTGIPVLGSAVVAFECALNQVATAGTHSILIGRVVDISLGTSEARPLLYARGEYGLFVPRIATRDAASREDSLVRDVPSMAKTS